LNLLAILVVALFGLLQAAPVTAAQQSCSYKKRVLQDGTTFDVSSRPAAGCAIQIVTISAVRKGEKVALFKSDVDYLAHAAQAAYLTGDGKPELIVFSKTPGSSANETLDVYFMKEHAIRRASLPELGDRTGYRGGDNFQIDGRLIVRKVPVYSESDASNKPSGGFRTVKYELKDGRLEELPVQNEALPADIPVVKVEEPKPAKAPTGKVPVEKVEASAEKAATENAPAEKQNAPDVPVKTAEEPSRYRAISEPYSGRVAAKKAVASIKEPPKAVVPGTVITGIKSGEAGIDISADRKIENYKIMTLDKPERIAIDISGATSALSGKKIVVNKFGISKVRVGNNKGFLRIVLDTAQKAFPKHKILTSPNGLTVEFSQ
jgi:hypothetical protein